MNVNLNSQSGGKGYNSFSLGEAYSYYHPCIPDFSELFENEWGMNACSTHHGYRF